MGSVPQGDGIGDVDEHGVQPFSVPPGTEDVVHLRTVEELEGAGDSLVAGLGHQRVALVLQRRDVGFEDTGRLLGEFLESALCGPLARDVHRDPSSIDAHGGDIVTSLELYLDPAHVDLDGISARALAKRVPVDLLALERRGDLRLELRVVGLEAGDIVGVC